MKKRLLKKLKCAACSGKGKNSRGNSCHPCGGTGKGLPELKEIFKVGKDVWRCVEHLHWGMVRGRRKGEEMDFSRGQIKGVYR